MAKHQNDGACAKCKELFEKFPGFEPKLRSWFTMFQAANPEAHISCAGRGADEQESKRSAGRSNASFGKSAHNWNAAIDLFCQIPGTSIYDEDWFASVVAPEIPDFLTWYGAQGSVYFELPHVELKNWREEKNKSLKLVEPLPGRLP